MPPRFCCCPGCKIDEDLFNRADADTLGIDWEEEDDTKWGIGGQVAYSLAGDNVARFKAPHKVPDESMEAYYDIIDEVDDAIYYILVNVKDLDNYHIAKFHNTATPKIELGKVVGGAYTMLKEENIVGMTDAPPCDHIPRYCRRLYARIAPDEFCAGISEATLSLVVVTPTIIADGIYSGMGGYHPEETLEYDNFYFGEHLWTNPQCPTCICQCEDTVIGDELVVTISDTTNRMTEAEGCEITINWDRVNGYWEGSATCCDFTWIIRLLCPSSNQPEDFEVLVIQGCKDSDTDTTVPGYIDKGHRSALEESTCDPFYLRFGPFQTTINDLLCACGTPMVDPTGVYYLEVTKAP
jgi:hypothetical protein